MIKRAIGVAAAALLGLVALPANAHLVRHTDPDDARGRLDIRAAEISGARLNGERYIDATLSTFDTLRPEDLNYGSFRVDFDSRRDADRDYFMLIFNNEGTVECTLYEGPTGFATAAGSAQLGQRSISCRVPRSSLRITRHLRWRAASENSGFKDSAPQRGWFQH